MDPSPLSGYSVGYNPNAGSWFDKALTDVGSSLGLGMSRTQQLGQAQSQQSRAQQQWLLDLLQQTALGHGPSAAQQQLQDARDQNISDAMAQSQAAAAGQGLGYQAALGNISNARARATQQAAGEAAKLRAQEQLSGMAQLGNTMSGVRNQDLNMSADLGGPSAGQSQSAKGIFGGIMNGLGVPLVLANGGYVPMVGGGSVAGQAPVPGDSPDNDIIKALLSPGEIVLPRSVAQSPHADRLAAAFVRAVKAKHATRKAA